MSEEKIMIISLQDGVLKILEKVGDISYNVLHVMKKLLGGMEKEFIVKPTEIEEKEEVIGND